MESMANESGYCSGRSLNVRRTLRRAVGAVVIPFLGPGVVTTTLLLNVSSA